MRTSVPHRGWPGLVWPAAAGTSVWLALRCWPQQWLADLVAATAGAVCVGTAGMLRRAAHQASHDPLTGLANRRLLLRHLRRRLASGHPPPLLLLDLGKFKRINDTYGHQAGDQILRAVAGRLRAAAGSAGLPARLGGDEFAVLFTAGDLSSCLHRAWATVAAVTGTYRLEGQHVMVDASAGLCLAGHPADTSDMLRAADRALYAAKRRQVPVIVSDPTGHLHPLAEPSGTTRDSPGWTRYRMIVV